VKDNLTYILSLLLLLTLAQPCWTQEDQELKPLKEVIASLEDTFDYKFNYLESVVEDVSVLPPNLTLSFEDTIDYLEKETKLSFQILENNFVSIRNQDELILCGYLKDKETLEPLAAATIQGLKESTVSDSNGYFELPIGSDDEMISIRFLGYKTLNRSYKYFKTNSCAPIYLISKVEGLSQVVLSSYLVEGIDKLDTGELEIDFNKFTILPGQIETDVLQTVLAFPGIQSVNETVSNINIRGGTHDQNLILWDEIKMYQSGHFFGLISAFNPQITRKVSLKKNGTSVDYTDGVSGTIAMATDESLNPTFDGSIGVNMIDGNAFLNIPIGKKSSLEITGRKSLNDVNSSPTYEEYFRRIAQDTEVENNQGSILNTDQEFDFYDTSLRWLYRPSDKDVVRLNFIYINNELIFNENGLIDNEETSRRSTVNQSNIGGGVFYQRDWNDRFRTAFQIYETDYKLKAVNANLLASQRFLQENIISETGAKLKASYKLSGSLLWDLGYQFTEIEITNLDEVDVPLTRILISKVVRSHAGFTQIDYQSKDQNTNMSVGVRYNYIDKFQKSIIEPRFSFHQQFLKHFSLELAGEFKHQITSQVINFQNDFLGIERRRWQLSNDRDIPVIQGKQVSIGLNYNRKGWLLSAEGYYKNVDGITTQSQEFQNQYEFIKSSGSYDVVGADFLIRKRFRNANLWLSYSFMNNDYTFSELPEQEFPSNLDITQAVTFGFTYRYKGLNFSSGLNWRTGKPITRPVVDNEIQNQEINYQSTNTNRLKDYLRVDVSVLYQFNIGKVKARTGVSVWNVLDRENTINNYYRINEEGEIQEFIQNSLGLTPQATLRVFF